MEMCEKLGWPETLCGEINADVLTEVGKVRIAENVFPTMTFNNNPQNVPDEIINFEELSIQDGSTKNFAEIYVEFSLTDSQVKNEAEKRICRTLARMAAKALALAEDKYFFQTSDRKASRDTDSAKSAVKFPANVKISNWVTKRDFGLLAEANPDKTGDAETLVTTPINVFLANQSSGENNAKWGEQTFKAVTEGISSLVAKAQGPDYALVLPTDVYADTFVPPSNASLVTTAERITPLVKGGFYTSGVLPEREGLLVALAGEPTKLYLGREATTEFVQQKGDKYLFRVVERVQYVVRDPRALVLLKFQNVAEEDAKKAAKKPTP